MTECVWASATLGIQRVITVYYMSETYIKEINNDLYAERTGVSLLTQVACNQLNWLRRLYFPVRWDSQVDKRVIYYKSATICINTCQYLQHI